MKTIVIIALLILSFASCQKQTSTPTPSTPTTPPTTTPNYAKGRIPLYGWGVDTFIAVDTVGSEIKHIDSFYSFVGSKGESMIKHGSNNYTLWMDTTAGTNYDTNANFGILSPIGIGVTINDTNSMSNMYFTYYTYPKTKTDGSGNKYREARVITLNNSFLNQNAIQGVWHGRD